MSSNPYERVKGGRLTFKGGSIATTSKSIDKKNKNKKKNKKQQQLHDKDDDHDQNDSVVGDVEKNSETAAGGEVYTIDAAKKLQYEQLFPVEAKKFGYKEKIADFKSVEDALDDRVKKKADRYCK
ncbi:uncharacterized protein LOC8289786 [Ricinus communis]|uniref:Uncharacterized protein n=1 Tax=Ricinus communis TaxID=3988 RepID=B9SF55_RICCO|nr:uncharacterized protein LOC8289786 [Ricinus communis]XP_048227439.1 uncharacterized protein LOC8289786 [Ricinus communis]EEF37749.1 conserved hypothetical protein [Ricinus communis]|eukprot:XP_002524624.1 uncharacterized protein LOC8289786 [Ricinus communis]